jgi:hypothetical protein
MPDRATNEVIEEIAAHLDDARSALMHEGLDPDLAEREALARLGNPEDLAAGVRRAHQPRLRFVTAIGPALLTAIGSSLAAWLLGLAILLPAALVALLVFGAFASTFHLASIGPVDWVTGPWTAFVIGYAARHVPRVYADAAMRRVADVRGIVALGGAAVLGVAAVFFVRLDLDPLAVISQFALPVAWIVGAMTASERPARRIRLRRVAAVLSSGVLVTLIGMELVGGATASEGLWFLGTSWDGSTAPDVALPVDTAPAAALGMPTDGGVDATFPSMVDVWAAWDSDAGLASWTGIRAEVWRSGPPQNPVLLDAAPVLTAPSEVVDVAPNVNVLLSLPMATDRRWYRIALTGVASDGRRYSLVPASIPKQVDFVGTAWDWLTTR